ncbi:MAG: RibD family protein [Vicinamibacterales bacterium]|nr:RibD family protein [Vicinamibacterales bacterium]
MPTLLTESSAWSLIRAVPTIRGDVHTPLRVHSSATDADWLQIDPAGTWLASAPLSDDARALVDLYLPLQLDPDLVIGQIGQSLDGRIATEQGQSHYITGPADILRLHRLRALVDAVVVGAGTVAADDPRLTVRGVEGSNPVRVVLDPDARLSPAHAVFTDGAAPTLVFHREQTASSPTARTEVVSLPAGPLHDDGDASPPGFHPRMVIEALRARGLKRLLIEGGGITVSRFLQAGALTRLHVAVAPILMGSGRPALTLPPIGTLDEALRPPCRHVSLGEDLLFDFDLRGQPLP